MARNLVSKTTVPSLLRWLTSKNYSIERLTDDELIALIDKWIIEENIDIVVDEK